MADYKIIDNFLDYEYFYQIKNLVCGDAFEWYFKKNLNNHDSGQHNYGYFQHLVFEHQILSRHSELFNNFYNLLNIFVLIRIKANFYPSNETLIHHSDHLDYPSKHKGAILSLNTCDGGTVLEDGTMIESIENRLLIFDSYKPHHSTNCTNDKGRWNININYIPEDIVS